MALGASDPHVGLRLTCHAWVEHTKQVFENSISETKTTHDLPFSTAASFAGSVQFICIVGTDNGIGVSTQTQAVPVIKRYDRGSMFISAYSAIQKHLVVSVWTSMYSFLTRAY